MPVTEFAVLKIKEPYTAQSEILQAKLRVLDQRQGEASSYPLTYYTDDKDPSILYVVSGWDTAESHLTWVRDESNQDFFATFGPLVSVEHSVHVDLDFNQFPGETGTLAYKVDVAAAEVKDAPGQIWVGHGVALEKKTDVYQFAAFNFDTLRRNSAHGDDIKIMNRVRL